MNEKYYEIMVQRQVPPLTKVIRITAFILAVFFVVLTLSGFLLAFLPAVFCAAGGYGLGLYQCIEYEYLYIDKELQIDRILGKMKRKRKETLDLNKIELLAPAGSKELERFQGRNYVKRDYSSGKRDAVVFVLVTDGKIITFEPSMELVNTIKLTQPRKVYIM